MARQALRKTRKLNEDWVRSVFKEMRSLVRRMRDQGPRCGSWRVEVRRYYRCSKCGLE